MSSPSPSRLATLRCRALNSIRQLLFLGRVGGILVLHLLRVVFLEGAPSFGSASRGDLLGLSLLRFEPLDRFLPLLLSLHDLGCGGFALGRKGADLKLRGFSLPFLRFFQRRILVGEGIGLPLLALGGLGGFHFRTRIGDALVETRIGGVLILLLLEREARANFLGPVVRDRLFAIRTGLFGRVAMIGNRRLERGPSRRAGQCGSRLRPDRDQSQQFYRAHSNNREI